MKFDIETAYKEIQTWLSKPELIEGMRLHTRYSNTQGNKIRLAKLTGPAKLAFLVTCMKQLLQKYKPKPNQKASPQKATPTQRIMTIEHELKTEFPKIDYKTLPAELKALIQTRIDAKKNAIELHALLHNCNTDEQRLNLAKQCVEAMILNWKIWEELNYYHKHKTVLGKYTALRTQTFEMEIYDLEQNSEPVEYVKQLIHQRTRAYAAINEYKRKKNLTPGQTEKLNEWIEKYNFLSDKLNEPKYEK